MGFMDFFKRKKDGGPDVLRDLVLRNIRKGYLLDYDMKTWQVETENHYDWGHGDITKEWKLVAADDAIFLELESDDDDEWCISRKIPVRALGEKLPEYIVEHDDPPETITYKGETYYLEESGGGHYYKDKSGVGEELLKWDFIDESGKAFISIERWGETDFEAAAGKVVEEYQFTNILPGS